jgi:hypothetical protein
LENGGEEPLKRGVKQNEVLKPHALQTLAVNLTRNARGLIGAGDIAEPQKGVQHLAQTSAPLIKIGGVLDFSRSPFANPDNAEKITRQNDPIDQMKAKKVHCNSMMTS